MTDRRPRTRAGGCLAGRRSEQRGRARRRMPFCREFSDPVAEDRAGRRTAVDPGERRDSSSDRKQRSISRTHCSMDLAPLGFQNVSTDVQGNSLLVRLRCVPTICFDRYVRTGNTRRFHCVTSDESASTCQRRRRLPRHSGHTVASLLGRYTAERIVFPSKKRLFGVTGNTVTP